MKAEGGSSCCTSHQWSSCAENGVIFLLSYAGAGVSVGGGESKGIHKEGHRHMLF